MRELKVKYKNLQENSHAILKFLLMESKKAVAVHKRIAKEI